MAAIKFIGSGALCLLLAACGAVTAPKIASPAIGLPEQLPADPREADKVAKDAFRNLNFFAEGRGMAMTPGLIDSFKLTSWTGVYDGKMRDRWGLIMDGRSPIGLTEVNYQGMRIGAIGCVMCHAGRAAGQTIVGLGNKTFDIVQLAMELREIERRFVAVTFANDERREVEASALGFVEHIANSRHGNLTRGMVPVSFVFGWFFRMAGEEPPADLHRAAVKIPALWGYGVKRHVGQFCDGYGDGRVPGWAVQVELTAGQKPETVRKYLKKIEAAEELFAAFLPPAYPFEHDRGAAEKGSEIFAENCRKCHGTYERDGRGLPIFQEPRLIEIDRVGTDRDRLDARSETLDRHVENSPLNDIIRHRSRPPAYFAPRLEGIWSRYPYLHNGSVPSIATLLLPTEERPVVFSLRDAGERERFDESKLGLTLPNERERTRLLQSGENRDRSVYDTRRTGHSNAGHDFGTDLDDAEKAALIEYLKTL